MIKMWLKYIITETAIDTFFKSIINNFQPEPIICTFKKHQTYNTIITRLAYHEFNQPRWVYTIYHECYIMDIKQNWIEINHKASSGYDCKRDGTDVYPYPSANYDKLINTYIYINDIVDYYTI